MTEEIKIDTAKVWYAADDLYRNSDWDKLWGDGTYNSWGLTKLKRQLRSLSYTVKNDSNTLGKINAATEQIENVQNNFIAPTTDKTRRVADCCKNIAVRYEDVERNMMLDFTGKRDDWAYMYFTSPVINTYNNLMNYWGHDVYARVEEVLPEPAKSWWRDNREFFESAAREVTEAAIMAIFTMGIGNWIEGGGFVIKGSEYAAEIGKTVLGIAFDKGVEDLLDSWGNERIKNVYAVGKGVVDVVGPRVGISKNEGYEDLSWIECYKKGSVDSIKVEYQVAESSLDFVDRSISTAETLNDIAENPIWENDYEEGAGAGINSIVGNDEGEGEN